MKKTDLIIKFLTPKAIKSFEKYGEPSAVAYENFLKTGVTVPYGFFNSIYVKKRLNYMKSKDDKVIIPGGEYFPNKPIWLVFDQSNGHKPSRRYVWWFDTKKDAIEWSDFHSQQSYSYPISKPVKFRPF